MHFFSRLIPKSLFLIFLGSLYQLTYASNAKDNIKKNFRIVALTSLSADLVNQINNDSLVGIPG